MPVRRRHRRRFKNAVKLHVSVFNAPPPPSPVVERDWSELPLDVLSHVLGKLNAFELLTGGAAVVCRSWRYAARKDPNLWRRVDMDDFHLPARRWRPSSPAVVARQAVLLSAGHCEAFCGVYDVDDDFLLFLTEMAPLLMKLRLNMCNNVTSGGFVKAIKKFSLLEELDIDIWPNVCPKGVIELVAEICPGLKHFGHTKDKYDYQRGRTDDAEASAIARMLKLRSLKLFRIDLTNEGVITILDNCPLLEFLDLRSCRKIKMDDTLRAKCARIKTKKLLLRDLSSEEVEEADFQPGSPISFCSTCLMFGRSSRTDSEAGSSDTSELEDCDDFLDSSDHLSLADEIDLDEHDWIIRKIRFREREKKNDLRTTCPDRYLNEKE